MQHPAPPSQTSREGLDQLRSALAAWAASAWLHRALVAMIATVIGQFLDQLEQLLQAWRNGTLPLPQAPAPRPLTNKRQAPPRALRASTPRPRAPRKPAKPAPSAKAPNTQITPSTLPPHIRPNPPPPTPVLKFQTRHPPLQPTPI